MGRAVSSRWRNRAPRDRRRRRRSSSGESNKLHKVHAISRARGHPRKVPKFAPQRAGGAHVRGSAHRLGQTGLSAAHCRNMTQQHVDRTDGMSAMGGKQTLTVGPHPERVISKPVSRDNCPRRPFVVASMAVALFGCSQDESGFPEKGVYEVTQAQADGKNLTSRLEIDLSNHNKLATWIQKLIAL